MRHLMLSTLLVATLAHADPTITIDFICVDSPPAALYPVPTKASKPACLPAPYGKGSALVVERNGIGAAAAWWCAKPNGKPPILNLYAVRWEAVTAGMLADYAKLAFIGSKAATIQAMTAKYQTDSVWNMCDVYEPALGRILAVRPQPVPPSPQPAASAP